MHYQLFYVFRAYDWEFFTIGSQKFLAVSNSQPLNNVTNDIESVVYRYVLSILNMNQRSFDVSVRFFLLFDSFHEKLLEDCLDLLIRFSAIFIQNQLNRP